jgi:nicotinamidase-related amidase
MNLLIIDPQNDFHTTYDNNPHGGALAVNGSIEDSTRIIEFLPNFKNVYVSLDTHTEKHIGHYGFWKRKDKNKDMSVVIGKPLTFNGESIIANDVEIIAADSELQTYAENYVKKVLEEESENNLGKTPMCWYTHCILGKPGHNIYEPLKDKLKELKSVEYFVKGQNELAEMYSIFRSEVQPKDIKGLPEHYNSGLRYNGEPSTSTDLGNVNIDEIASVHDNPYLITEYNKNNGSLLNKLIKEKKDVYICGEALSHCVNYSLRDFAKYASDNKFENKFENRIKLVMNASSCVVLPVEGMQKLFYKNIVKLIDDITSKKDGLHLVDIVFWNGTDFISSDKIVSFIKTFYEGKSDTAYSTFKNSIQSMIKQLNMSDEFKEKKGGKRRRTRKRSKRKRTQRKQKRSERKRTRRSRR